VEEVTRAVMESDWLYESDDGYELLESLPPLAIPPTLQDTLTERLDRLGTAKGVAQLAATIGREFSVTLLQALAPADKDALQQALQRLVEAGILYLRGVHPETRYLFKHVLIQEAAYSSLLKKTRQQYHRKIAQVLAEQFPAMVETQPEFLAQHYTEAGLPQEALVYWQLAGKKAMQRSAHSEAIAHLTKGLMVLQEMPDTPERIQHELALCTALGAPQIATRGYAAAEVGQVFRRARELCQYVGDPAQLFQVLQGLWGFYIVRAELQTALQLAEQLHSIAHTAQDDGFLLEAAGRLGISLFLLGDFVTARGHLEQGMALYDPVQHRSHAFLYGQDPRVACLCHAAWLLWLLGYPDQAVQRSREALTLAQELSHPHSLAFAHLYAALVHQLRREWAAAREQAEALMALSSEQGFTYRLLQGRLLQGRALVQQGQSGAAIAQMQQSLAGIRAIGAEVYRPYFQALLAAAYAQAGQPMEGLTLLSEVLTVVDKTQERFYEAGLYRLQGELLLQLPAERQTEAASCFQHALDLARRQQAKSLELEAAISLGRLWQREGRRGEACQLLTDVYGWFSEGFDTENLQEIRALCAQLI
jgi:predicted ATPase